jgi:hypothetical protein
MAVRICFLRGTVDKMLNEPGIVVDQAVQMPVWKSISAALVTSSVIVIAEPFALPGVLLRNRSSALICFGLF